MRREGRGTGVAQSERTPGAPPTTAIAHLSGAEPVSPMCERNTSAYQPFIPREPGHYDHAFHASSHSCDIARSWICPPLDATRNVAAQTSQLLPPPGKATRGYSYTMPPVTMDWPNALCSAL